MFAVPLEVFTAFYFKFKVCHAFAVIADTLKRNGSVLMPICPTGVLYDLLEVISMQLDQVK